MGVLKKSKLESHVKTQTETADIYLMENCWRYELEKMGKKSVIQNSKPVQNVMVSWTLMIVHTVKEHKLMKQIICLYMLQLLGHPLSFTSSQVTGQRTCSGWNTKSLGSWKLLSSSPHVFLFYWHLWRKLAEGFLAFSFLVCGQHQKGTDKYFLLLLWNRAWMKALVQPGICIQGSTWARKTILI